MNRLCAQFLSAGRPLVVCTTRNLKLRVIQYLVILLCPGRRRVWPWGFSLSSDPWAGHGPRAWQAGRKKPPMCSVPECRQTPGGLPHQKSKAQGGTVSSEPLQSLAGSKYTRRASILPSSLGMIHPQVRRAGRQNPPTCSVPECRQTTGGLHHQKSKSQGGTLPSDPFLSLSGSKYGLGASPLPQLMYPVLIWFLGSLQLNFSCSYNTLDISHLSDGGLVKIISQSVGCQFCSIDIAHRSFAIL